MPRTGKTKAGTSETVTLRLDHETAQYYRRRAKENGATLSELLRKLLLNGMLSETAQQSEQNMYAMLQEMRVLRESVSHTRLPDSLVQAIYFCEYILTEIMSGKSIQSVYEAQTKAKERLNREKSQANEAAQAHHHSD